MIADKRACSGTGLLLPQNVVSKRQSAASSSALMHDRCNRDIQSLSLSLKLPTAAFIISSALSGSACKANHH
jgi:hypothetical protein